LEVQCLGFHERLGFHKPSVAPGPRPPHR
jgi:hypothetical protein